MIIIWYYLVVCVCSSDDLRHFTKEWVPTRGEPGSFSCFSSTLLMLYLFIDTTAWNIISIISWDLLNSLFSSVHFNCSVMSDSLRPHELQDTGPPCPSPTPRVYPNSCPLSRWCHLTVSSSVILFCSCPQSFPASGSFPVSQLTSGGQSMGVSSSASVLPMNIQDWFPLGLTGLIFLQSKGLSRVFSNTTVLKHQFLDAQLSL